MKFNETASHFCGRRFCLHILSKIPAKAIVFYQSLLYNKTVNYLEKGESALNTPVWNADLGDGTYRNPILNSDWSDPDVIRVGSDYYMVASSFCSAPAVPLLNSNDLVNWKLINYVAERLPSERYNAPQHGSGAWAPSIRYREGVFYVFVPYPDEGIAVYTTQNPRGKWSDAHFVLRARGWIDPCPFWDDDGSLYMINAFAKSRIGFKSVLYLSRLREGENGLWADTDSGGVIFDGHKSQPTIEGPKLYKRGEFYYIFAPAGGVKTGWQTVLRSKTVTGPYEERIVLRQGETPINGPHQGAWVDTPSGEDWFIHFQDAGAVGRVIHLQPMRWSDGWPVIGENTDSGGCGEPVLRHKKPDTGAVCPPCAPDFGDGFDSGRLGLQWQFNANFSRDWFRFDGGLLLKALPSNGARICDLPNLMLQKWPAPEFTLTVKLDFGKLRDGGCGGAVSLGGLCDSLIFKRSGERLILERKICSLKGGSEQVETIKTLESNEIQVRMAVRHDKIFWEISESAGFEPIGEPSQALAGAWVGVKVGLVAYSPSDKESGELKAEFFRFEPLKPEEANNE